MLEIHPHGPLLLESDLVSTWTTRGQHSDLPPTNPEREYPNPQKKVDHPKYLIAARIAIIPPARDPL